MANWANTSRLGHPLSPGWQDNQLTWIEPVKGQRWQVHKQAATAFDGLLKDLIAAGYNPTSSGGFNYRTKRGRKSLSQHAFGTAIDLNADANPMLSAGQKRVSDLPPNTAEIAKKWGLDWGGNWKSPDSMHFEYQGQGFNPNMATGGSSTMIGGPGQADPITNPYASMPDGPKGEEVYKPADMGSVPGSLAGPPMPEMEGMSGIGYLGMKHLAAEQAAKPKMGDRIGLAMEALAKMGDGPSGGGGGFPGGPSPGQLSALPEILKMITRQRVG